MYTLKVHNINADNALYCIKIYRNYISICQTDVNNALKTWLQNGTKNNNTSSNMLLDHCYAFGLSL